MGLSPLFLFLFFFVCFSLTFYFFFSFFFLKFVSVLYLILFLDGEAQELLFLSLEALLQGRGKLAGAVTHLKHALQKHCLSACLQVTF